MSASTTHSQKPEPAQLGFLAIYNPSLGTTDETLDDQIVYYSSPETRSRRRQRRRTNRRSPPKSSPQEEKNERLRNIGLAQGMVEFGRDFSDGKPVDTVETEKSRIILHEFEAGWWLLASIDLTRLPTSKGKPGDDDAIEYSSREVKPPALLLEDLLRAHSTFLLHHASSLSALFVRARRSKFVSLVGCYWDSFLSTWNVMLHGNPVVNVYGGIKLAGSGELGMGVGEEDRGSSEREVLEGFVGRIEGLVDLVVSKFGGAEPAEEEKGSKESQSESRILPKQPWLGTGAEPMSEDGAVFLGVGALSRKSLRDITHWMEDLYSWGSRAYGVGDNLTSTRKSRGQREKPNPDNLRSSSSPKVPKEPSSHVAMPSRPDSGPEHVEEETNGPIEAQATISRDQDISHPHSKTRSKQKQPRLHRRRSSQSSGASLTTTGGKFVNFMKLGYGTHWSLGGVTTKSPHEHRENPSEEGGNVPNQHAKSFTQEMGPNKSLPTYYGGSDSSPPSRDDSVGHYLVGLMGDIENDEAVSGDGDDTTADEGGKKGSNLRLLLRTVTVELEQEGDTRAETEISIDLGTADNERSHSSKRGGSEQTGTSHTFFKSQDPNKTKKLRIVVYVNKPFIFTFLFELRTDALAFSSLYRSLHYQLGPLQKSLLASTGYRRSRPDITTTNSQEAKSPIYDFIWDAKQLTISSTIPNIPEPSGMPNSPTQPHPWSRIEALNTHMQLLNTFAATRGNRMELESTCKTSRGWWVVWTRIPDPETGSVKSNVPLLPPGSRMPQLETEDSVKTVKSGSTSMTTGTINQSVHSGPAHPFLEQSNEARDWVVPKDKEIFLLRRASDYVVGKGSGMFGTTSSVTGENSWGSGTAKLAQGIGVDTKRYIEDLLNMNR